ncbi:MAG: chemotaxis protein CheB [Parafilimonas sp.]|nr:chemotaxis protein CheB [Parafilimonas sp.]
MAQNTIAKYKMIVIGGSAGSLNIVLKIVAALPVTTYLSVVIIMHRKNDNESVLSNLLSARTNLIVKEVEDKEDIAGGCIYLAPADYHLLLENKNMFCLDISEKVHHSRPSIDVTFESVAEVIGDKAVAVLLSGANADGADGLHKIKQAGGYTIVQDPASAEVGYMPQQAIDQMQPDKILNGDDIGDFIKQLLS